LFRHIILPGIAPTLLLLMVLASIFSFKQFSIIFLLTGGGPAGSTETLVVRIWNTAFRFYDFSYSATLGVAGLVIAFDRARVHGAQNTTRRSSATDGAHVSTDGASSDPRRQARSVLRPGHRRVRGRALPVYWMI
jgi:multiple sugar transport system permease protein